MQQRRLSNTLAGWSLQEENNLNLLMGVIPGGMQTCLVPIKFTAWKRLSPRRCLRQCGQSRRNPGTSPHDQCLCPCSADRYLRPYRACPAGHHRQDGFPALEYYWTHLRSTWSDPQVNCNMRQKFCVWCCCNWSVQAWASSGNS